MHSETPRGLEPSMLMLSIARALGNESNITVAVLASADHDLQIWLRPNANYGEAVGITPIDETSRDALASLAPQHREPTIDLVAEICGSNANAGGLHRNR